MEQRDNYLLNCVRCYKMGITPSNTSRNFSDAYLELKKASQEFIDKYGLQTFSEFLKEGQYLVDLWTAHLLLDYSNLDPKLKQESLELIKLYAEKSPDISILEEEKNWLKRYFTNI